MCFLMFSFHVHEKQILCPLIFFGLAFPEVKQYFSAFLLVSNFSMLRLYTIEGNLMTYAVLTASYQYAAKRLEGCALNGFKLTSDAKPDQLQKKSGLVIYNESYKLNVADSAETSWFLQLLCVRIRNLVCNSVLGFVLAFHLLHRAIPVTARYPHLPEVINISFSFGMFAFTTLFVVAKMTE